MELKPGLRLESATCDTQVVVVKAPRDAGDVDLRVPEGSYRCQMDRKAIPPFGVKCVDGETKTITAATAVGRLSLRATD